MTLRFNSTACPASRFFEPMVGFWASFSSPRFDSSGTIVDLGLRDQTEQEVIMKRIAGQTLRCPLRPQLHGMFEADVPGVHARVERRLRHQQADHVVGQ